MDNRKIIVINDSLVKSKEIITIHIICNESLTLKELTETLNFLNRGINDVNRENGIKSNVLLGTEYAAEVSKVEHGSIVLQILTNFVAPVALSILGNFLYDRLKNIGAKKEKRQEKTDTAYPIAININGNENVIEVNITKP